MLNLFNTGDNMQEIAKQKKIADEILSKLEIIDPYCILAGGAPGDWYFDRPANDLDFYVHSVANTIGAFAGQLKALGYTSQTTKDSAEFSDIYKKMPNLESIHSFTVDRQSVQVMQMSKPTFGLIQHFACNMSKAYYKGGRICTELDFRLGAKTQLLWLNETYCWNDYYPKKIREKYQQFGIARNAQQAKDILLQQVLA